MQYFSYFQNHIMENFSSMTKYLKKLSQVLVMQLLKANQILVSKQKLLMLFSAPTLIYLLLIIPLNAFVLLHVKGSFSQYLHGFGFERSFMEMII